MDKNLKIMKAKQIILFLILSVCIISCGEDEKYPRYDLGTTIVVPDSLQPKYREWVKETVRAASQHMTGGDYEDVDETIEQAEISGKRLFGKNQTCLLITPREYSVACEVKLSDMTVEQKFIYYKLLKNEK